MSHYIYAVLPLLFSCVLQKALVGLAILSESIRAVTPNSQSIHTCSPNYNFSISSFHLQNTYTVSNNRLQWSSALLSATSESSLSTSAASVRRASPVCARSAAISATSAPSAARRSSLTSVISRSAPTAPGTRCSWAGPGSRFNRYYEIYMNKHSCRSRSRIYLFSLNSKKFKLKQFKLLVQNEINVIYAQF